MMCAVSCVDFKQWIIKDVCDTIRTSIASELKGLTKEITDLKNENTVLKTRLTEAETEIAKLKSEISDKSDRIGKLEPVVNNSL